ncbi:MAG: helix-turn-helix domain-containing protein [Prevotella sp.]|jgi:DNA-binding XRE family transcriptional regulator|nr:helix-turn-helix domain-containing protein [Prevotella sp.]
MSLRIKEILKEKGIAVKELAVMINLAAPNVSNLINEKSKPSIDVFERIAAALNVPISDLFDTPTDNTVNCPYCGGKIKLTKDGANPTPGVKPRPVTAPTPTPPVKAPEQSPAKDDAPELGPDVTP